MNNKKSPEQKAKGYAKAKYPFLDGYHDYDAKIVEEAYLAGYTQAGADLTEQLLASSERVRRAFEAGRNDAEECYRWEEEHTYTRYKNYSPTAFAAFLKSESEK